ncbi:NAD(+) synthase [Kosmotoga pacifica]|uniref:NH(3)-dependent NAD(+) synthetase n=1 Tax=Kosmotoga pacifica TaxID=1330330 RepID=A0A0G2ZDA1_9BACT|nr:NAD(+) synthase [Kosmotoga pacifica]AKI96793.1 NAD synthetase [Kosmotoga pacifica]
MEKIVEFIRKTIDKYDYKGAVVGISGGVDSAVTASLCVKALGKERVLALLLPERDSSPDSLKLGVGFCNWLGISYQIVKITPILRVLGVYKLQPPAFLIPYSIKKQYALKKWEVQGGAKVFINDLKNTGDDEMRRGMAYYRAKHRVRMCVLYLEAEKKGFAVVGTTNRTEYLTGFYVKWGDDATDIEPLLHLYKTEVFELAEKLGIPEKIVKRPPSPDLIPGLTDEAAMGISYTELDRILKKFETGASLEDEPQDKVSKVKALLEAAKYRNVRMLSLERGGSA